MDIVRAASVYALMDERKYIETLIKDINATISCGGVVGSATIAVPRRCLPAIKAILEAEFDELTKKVAAL